MVRCEDDTCPTPLSKLLQSVGIEMEKLREDDVARHIKTDLLKMASPEKKAQCVLGYMMFFLGFVKDVVYRTKVHNVVELKQRTQAAIEIVDQGMLQRSCMELEYRLDTQGRPEQKRGLVQG
ncbi:hypothetical protein AVEN_179412-1 [Araneus ventricosus]|uniref:Uncharacterized protein n=1 Tax=Araneus ventricosus TaxID=182803 RepID=A0A4Y2BH78_ARAVE|nr:hypothetical protein AVEN_179412-1 [Araneus ventricosus]